MLNLVALKTLYRDPDRHRNDKLRQPLYAVECRAGKAGGKLIIGWHDVACDSIPANAEINDVVMRGPGSGDGITGL